MVEVYGTPCAIPPSNSNLYTKLYEKILLYIRHVVITMLKCTTLNGWDGEEGYAF
jgi:hypothetical protein